MWLFCLDIVILPCNGKGSDHLTQFEGGKCYIHVQTLVDKKTYSQFQSDFKSVNIPQCQKKKNIFKKCEPQERFICCIINSINIK